LEEVFLNFLFDIVKLPIYFILAVVVFFAVGSPEFAAIDSESFTTDESYILKKDGVKYKAVFEGFGVVFTEVCDGIVVGSKSIDEPSDFDVSQTFRCESSAASYSIKISVEVEFEKDF